MRIGTELDRDHGDDVATLPVDDMPTDIGSDKYSKNDRHSVIRRKIEDLLDQRRLVEEFLPFDDVDF